MADNNVVFDELSKIESLGYCLMLAILYVLVFYIWNVPYHRDHPSTIKLRCIRAIGFSIVAPIFIKYVSQTSPKGVPVQRWLGIHGENLNKAAVFPSLLIMILFAGPLTMMCLAEELPLMKKFSPSFDLINIRNLIIAPITEEFIYRACMIPLLVPSFGLMGAIFICPLLFGVAHFHHAIERLQGSKSNVLIVTFFQFSYTTLFGVYSAFIFVRTGHLIGSFISHSFCNYMGVPEFEQINNTKFPKVVAGMFVIGLVLFLCFLFPLTEPNMYNSIYFK